MTDLNAKLSTYRDEEVQKRSRVAELAEQAEKRELNSDEIAEISELEGRIKDLGDQQRAIESSLKIGNFSQDVNKKLDMSEKEQREYSVLKLLRALDPKATQKDRDQAGFELELSEEIEKRLGTSARGAYMPTDVMGDWNGVNPFGEKRDLDANTYTGAAGLIGTDFRPNQMIPLLRNAMALTSLGATYLDGLVGDVAIPKQTGAATAGWIGRDGGSISESDQTVDQVTLTPRTLGVYTDYSRQLRLQSSIAVENFIRQDLMKVVALAKDVAAFHGTGSSGEPVGIANVTGIGTQSFSTAANPTRAEIIGLRTDLASANALGGSLGFATDSTVIGNLLDTAVDAGSGRFLMDDTSGNMLGYSVVESNQITAGNVFFGNWSDLLVGTWGGMELMVDPYTGATAGTTRVLVFHSCDIAVRHAESFSLGS